MARHRRPKVLMGDVVETKSGHDQAHISTDFEDRELFGVLGAGLTCGVLYPIQELDQSLDLGLGQRFVHHSIDDDLEAWGEISNNGPACFGHRNLRCPAIVGVRTSLDKS
jgi:hypothetical protein